MGSILTSLRDGRWLTADRLWRIAAVLAGIALVATAADFRAHVSHGLTDRAGEHLARDFVNYWTGPRLLLEGKATLAYDTKAYIAYQRDLIAPAGEFKMYSYPPTAMLLALPLAWLGFIPGLALWSLAGLAWCAALLGRLLGRREGVIAAVAAPATFVNAISGQNGQFSAGILCGGLMLVERRPWIAGLLLGCLCYKPQMAVLLPVALAAGGHWRCFLATGAAALALVAASAVVAGAEAWTGFLHQTTLQRALMETAHTFWHRMPTMFAAMRTMGAPVAAAYAVQIVSAALAAVAVALAWRGRGSVAVKSATLVIATYLATPYAWDYDLVAVTFAVAWLSLDAARTRFLAWEKLTLAILAAMPLAIGPLTLEIGLQLGPFALWAGLGFALRRALAPVAAGTAEPRGAETDPAGA